MSNNGCRAGPPDCQAAVQVLSGARGQHTMVFCNSIQACRAVDHFLTEAGVATVCFHGDMPIPARKDAIRAFTGVDPDRAGGVARGPDEVGPGAGEPPVLVCTDLAARGLDMPVRVQNIVNFDMSLSAKDYLHRAGRTARAGASGTVTSLLQSAMERTLAFRIEGALKRNEPLDMLTPVRSDAAGRPAAYGGRGSTSGPRAKTARGSNHRKYVQQEKNGVSGRGGGQGRGTGAGRGSSPARGAPSGRGGGRGRGGQGRGVGRGAAAGRGWGRGRGGSSVRGAGARSSNAHGSWGTRADSR